MKKYVKNAVKSALSKPLRGRYRRFISIGVSAILAVSTFLTIFPQMSVPVYAAGTDKDLQLGASALAPVMTSVREQGYDPDEKYQVTTAQTVYYGSSGSQKWYVIGCNGNGAVQMPDTVTLFAENNLATGQPYHNQYNPDDRSNHYNGSDIKPVVDGYYNLLFTYDEKAHIAERSLAHEDYSSDHGSFCDGISDTNPVNAYLWLLSTKEADLVGQAYREANADWWLRSPGSSGNRAALVGNNGYVDYTGIDVYIDEGVRPAFNLNLSSIILTSAAEGGKDPGTGDAGTLNEVDAYTGDAWKLTISDSTRSSFTASAGTGATVSMPEGYTSWTVPVTYSGAQTGTNEHVSAILTNSAGTALYYGHIATASEEGTKNVTIPTGLAKGTYTLNVFNEQCNGDKKTDLSSSIRTIGLTVTEAQQVATPTFTPAEGTYTEAQNVEIKCDTAGADIYYTIPMGGLSPSFIICLV